MDTQVKQSKLRDWTITPTPWFGKGEKRWCDPQTGILYDYDTAIKIDAERVERGIGARGEKR